MKTTISDAGACRKTINFEIPAEDVAEERKQILKAFAKAANIPGFRKGKAPTKVVAKRYAAEVAKEVEERIVPKFYHEAIKESGMKVVGIVDMSEVAVKEDQPLEFDVTVDVEPDFKLPKYVGIPVKEDLQPVTEEQVQEQVDAIRNQHATYELTEEDKSVEPGDMAELAYEATIDGKPLEEVVPEAKGLGKGEGYWVSADEHAFIPGMGKAIGGMKKGDTKEVEIDFPDDYLVKELAGTKALYKIEVTGIKVSKIPEIDEAFLKSIGVESEEELRRKVREELEKRAKTAARSSKYDQIVQYLLKKTTLDLPESIVERQTRNSLYDITRQRLAMGATPEQLETERKEIAKEARERAIENVKIRYIGLAVADEQGFDATPSEISEEIAMLAIQQGKDARALRKEMQEDGSIASVEEQVRFNKALDYMLENAKIK